MQQAMELDAYPSHPFYTDPRTSLAYAALISLLVLLGSHIWTKTRGPGAGRRVDVRGREEQHAPLLRPSTPSSNTSGEHVPSFVIFWNVAQFVGCLALLGISVAAAAGAEEDEVWVDVAQVCFFAYTFILALFTFTALRTPWVHRHLLLLLLLAFAFDSYRNLLPLATFHSRPLDVLPDANGWTSFVWWRVGLLGAVGVVAPLLVPRIYQPVDPEHPSPSPAAEQTASIVSRALFLYVTPLVLQAWKLPALPFDAIPPSPDIYASRILADNDMANLDPKLMPAGTDSKSRKKRERHVFFGLLVSVRTEAILVGAMLVIKLVTDFSRPMAMQMLLGYIEDPAAAEVRPAVGVAVLFIGPLVGSLAMQFARFINARVLVKVESLLSQLIVSHSLRLRFVGKPQASTPSPSSRASTPSTVLERFEPVAAKPVDKGEDLVGKINNLLGSDLQAIAGSRNILVVLIYSPFQAILAAVLLYRLLSWSAFVGIFTTVATLPIPVLVLKQILKTQKNLAVATDTRVQAVSEAMSSIRMVKMLAWESKVAERIALARETELRLIRKLKGLDILDNCINVVVSFACMIATFAVYTTVQKEVLSASKLFSAVSVFEILKNALYILFWQLGSVSRGKVSLDRLDDFLHNSELIDELDSQQLPNALPSPDSSFIGFKNATFAWLREATPDDAIRNFRLHLDVFFVPGGINIIAGPTGSGKSSVLAALLGEMHFEPTSVDSSFSLPRSGDVAFVPQEPWLINASIRENILLSSPFDATRFAQVIEACALTRDLELLSGGDATEVGERGITLSGGQKARINLARAVYSNAEILLMDDILSALDAHTSKWVVEKCLSSNLVKGRTIIFATHHVSLVVPVASFILRLGRDGKTESQGPVEKVIKEDKELEKQIAVEVKEDARIIEDEDKSDQPPYPPKATVLVEDETKASGKMSWTTYREVIRGLGWKTLVLFVFTMVAQEVGKTVLVWWLGQWGNQYEVHDATDVSVPWYLGIYTFISLSVIAFYSYGLLSYYTGVVRASESLHSKLVTSILSSTLLWLNTTPVGRILNRFTSFGSLDGLSLCFSHLLEISCVLVVKLVSIVITVPSFLLPSVILGIAGIALGELYLHCQLSVKREMANAKSPVFNHLNSAINGVVSIRAFGIQEWIGEGTRSKVDTWARAALTFFDLDGWIGISIDALANAFTASLAGYLLYNSSKMDAGTVGFTLSLGITFSSQILWWVQKGNEFMRITEYYQIPHEPAFVESGRPPAAWPTSGSIVVEGLTVRYSEGGPPVLNDLSFSLKSGEKIGVVGRTGAGKSSLALALLRMIPTEGKVVIDGIESNNLNLSTLRSTITIIPQDPILLSGTLRYNLDPERSIDDATLNDALNASGLSSLQAGLDATSVQTITLDTEVSSGGSNLSQGQRQVLVLARALVRRSKIIIMDEATSSVDHQTDEAIQRGIRNELQGVTVITIAHRLRSIADYDRVLCLSEGKIVAFDTTRALLSDPESYFSMLVKSSGEEEALRKMILG